MHDDDYDDDSQSDAEAEAAYDQMRKDLMPELYEEFAEGVLSGKDDLYGEIIEQFTSERLQSFYLSNPNVAERAIGALEEARSLRSTHLSAALVFAAIAIEVGLRKTLLIPILHGMVSIDSAATLVAALVPDQHNDSFKKALFGILKEIGNVDILNIKRTGCTQTLWDEIANVRVQRNEVIHGGNPVSSSDAERAIEVASMVVETLFPQVICALGLRTDGQLRIVTK